MKFFYSHKREVFGQLISSIGHLGSKDSTRIINEPEHHLTNLFDNSSGIIADVLECLPRCELESYPTSAEIEEAIKHLVCMGSGIEDLSVEILYMKK